jgi:hypothetical protein
MAEERGSPQERDNRLCPMCKGKVLLPLQALIGASPHGEGNDEMGTYVQTETIGGTEDRPNPRERYGQRVVTVVVEVTLHQGVWEIHTQGEGR